MRRKKLANGLIYESFIYAFRFVSLLLRHRIRLNGKEHLSEVPPQVVFTVTHDSYYEIPSLSKVYFSLKPRPVFTVMAKRDFLSGKYLSTNYAKNNSFLRSILILLDKTGLPKAFLTKMRLITIPRPFIEGFEKKKQEIKTEISDQMDHFKNKIANGFSTLIFPEGTTWGYGGLKKLRSAVYQLVDSSYTYYKKKVYVLPINVKVDKLVRGAKDIFINVGMPEFIEKSKEEFNNKLQQILLQLHTITFSQLAAYYFKKLTTIRDQLHDNIVITREHLCTHLQTIVERAHALAEDRILPSLDPLLVDRKYLNEKIERFIRYCVKKKYVRKVYIEGRGKAYALNRERILSQYPAHIFRKQNPLAYHANELVSLGESTIESVYSCIEYDVLCTPAAHSSKKIELQH